MIEQIVKPTRLRDVTTQAISVWVAELRDGRADTTVGLYCTELRAALGWAKEMEFISEVPTIRPPKGAKEGKPKGRPINLEEHERMLAAVSKVVKAPSVDAYRRLLDGLWWSGLRLGEAVRLSWEPDAAVSVIMHEDYRPALRFRPDGHKGRRAELIPCAPEFAQLLDEIPEHERCGQVFDVGVSALVAGKWISKIGKKAQIVVNEQTRKAASAQDYRRSFGTRWAKRIMPAVLKRLMRHRAIETTLKYYVEQDVDDIADNLWVAYERATGNTLGNTGREKAVKPR